MKTLPAHVTAYKRTPEFTATSIPKGLLRAHSTRSGTWGKIVVLEGRLRFRILEPEVEEIELSPEQPGVVEPLVRHEVAALGEVAFYVEFYAEAGY